MREKAAILIDFWTYSCVNCIRTLPHLKAWYERYKDKGLIIVGAHTPEFEFEKNVENVTRAIKDFGIEYPVVMDSDYEIWSLYSNNAWPSKFLINKDGQIVYGHIGEGGYRETEEAIQKALLELNPGLKLPPVPATEEGSAPSTSLGVEKVCLPTTPELYLGSMRGHAGKLWDYRGTWKVFPEYVEHERQNENFEDYLLLNFEASEANLVMEFGGERAAKIRLELDGKLLRDIEVREAKMYNLLSPKDVEHKNSPLSPELARLASRAKRVEGPATSHAHPRRQLKIYSRDAGLRAYAFTFGGCAESNE